MIDMAKDEQQPDGPSDERWIVQFVGRRLIGAVSNIDRLVKILFRICAVLAIVDLVFLLPGFDRHAHFGWENWPEFYAAYGFMSCALLVLISRFFLRPLLMRKEDYYD
ncbi:MAG: O-antigen/teichoic acid export membrane protein [Limisphaerales bacterium]